ncbi:hypothetical protein SAMN04487948_1406 [Halogranum amylolyticum]|uniref:Uncharacterized protein n=1 Tax=Halogranum amylolyticum TaxID=660520 RepID=A0A1H8WSC1_9EURY|nr:hypothetical protein [Halogranum amylolyticum]SEP30551.1 hypothetical protein SAMN04487948_1406 [Halogranum amylolyticum]
MNVGSQQLAVVAVVLITLVSGVADAGVAASPTERIDRPVVSDPSTTNVTRTNAIAVGPNAAVGLSLRANELDDRLATLAHRERLAATTAENETAVLAVELRAIRRATNRLETRQTEVLEQHARRNATTRDLVFELAAVDASARRLESRRDAAVARLDDLSAAGVDTRALRADLMALQGPVRARVAAMAVGTVDGTSVGVETTRDSVALGVHVDDRTVVERYRADYLDAPTDEPATIEGVSELVASNYPAEWENRTGYTIRRIDADLLYVEVEYTDGVVVAYVDRTTGLVFKEFHYGPRSNASDPLDRLRLRD